MGKIINTENPCCTCKRQEGIDGKAWTYCDIYNHIMQEVELFDETGELHGCHLHKKPVIDWEKVPIDAPVEVAGNTAMHFSHYDKPTGIPYFWSNGRTSYTTVYYEQAQGATFKLINTEVK